MIPAITNETLIKLSKKFQALEGFMKLPDKTGELQFYAE